MGIERWKGYEKIEATTVTGGGFFPLRGLVQDPNPRRMTVWPQHERASLLPYGALLSAPCSLRAGLRLRNLTARLLPSGARLETPSPAIR
jgi:hypothetical protein